MASLALVMGRAPQRGVLPLSAGIPATVLRPVPTRHHCSGGASATEGRGGVSLAAAAVPATAALIARRHRADQRRGLPRRHDTMVAATAGVTANVEKEELRKVVEVAEAAARAAGKVMAEKVGAEVVEVKGFAADLLTAVDTECEEVVRQTVQNAFPSHAFLGEESFGSLEDMATLIAAPGWLWVVDPIDGTTNFVSGQPMSAVSIGVAHDGKLCVGVIYDPYRDELFSASLGGGASLNGSPIAVSADRARELREAVVASGAPPNPRSSAPCFRAMSLLSPPRSRTVRILGSAAINFAWVACGRLDAWFEPDLSPWDSAAGALLVREAGGRVTDCEGNEYVLGTRPICSSNGKIHDELLAVLREADATQLDD